MAALPEKQFTTVVKIYEHWSKATNQDPRPHLGASIIGKECRRALWYDFRWATRRVFEGRMLRLFDTGQREEGRLVADLRNAGVTVYDRDPETGKQFRFLDHGGHFSGSMDASLKGLVEAPSTWHVGEFKTHNTKSFDAFKKNGVKASKPVHWHQMNTYMGWSGMKRAAYFPVCKDNDEIDLERVEFDKDAFELDRAKAKTIIEAPEPLSKISEDPSFYECNLCDHRGTCHGGRAPAMSCRTCAHSTPITDQPAREEAPWGCARYGCSLSYAEQLKGCVTHVFIPALLPWAEPLVAGDDWVIYRNKLNGRNFCNHRRVADEPFPDGLEGALVEHGVICMYSSAELNGCPPRLVGDPGVDALKVEADATVKPQPQEIAREPA